MLLIHRMNATLADPTNAVIASLVGLAIGCLIGHMLNKYFDGVVK